MKATTVECSGAVRSNGRPNQMATINRVTASLDYMMANLNQPMRISALCAMAGFSESRFFELFKAITGYSPLNWFIRARMRRAAELLENSELQIKEIASQVGYDDPLYFSRLFKSVYEISPSQHRSGKRLAAMNRTPDVTHGNPGAEAGEMISVSSQHAGLPGRENRAERWV